MKPGDEILIRAKLISVHESDNEVTVGFDSTTTAVVPLGAVEGQGAAKLTREQFEAWWLERHPGSQFNDLKRTSKSGAYDKGWLNDCWLAWNAALAAALKERT